MIWGGPSSKEPLLGTFKILQDGLVTDSSTISVTTDRVKGGLYRSDVTTVPTNVRKLPVDGNNVIPNEVTIGVHDGSKLLTDDSAAPILRLPVPSVNFYFLKNLDDANVSRDYERYTDFKYSITGIPNYLELDPDVESNKLWTKEGDAIVMHRTPNNPFPASLYPSEMYPALRLKKDALSATDTRELIANQNVSILHGVQMALYQTVRFIRKQSLIHRVSFFALEMNVIHYLKVPSVMITND